MLMVVVGEFIDMEMFGLYIRLILEALWYPISEGPRTVIGSKL